MNQGFFYVVLMVVAFCGLAIANYIYNKKRLLQPLICPTGSNCDNVIHSRYSRLFNVPLEVIGALYYTIVIISYSVFLATPTLHSPGAAVVLVELTAAAFLFSIYLTGVQAVILKEWCTWCLGSAFVCAAIVIVELSFAGFDLTVLIKNAFS